MLALVVLAHPRPDGFACALAERVCGGLRGAGYEVELLDLDRLGFRAAMSREERAAYHGDLPILDPLVRRHADLVRRASVLALVYPTWWSGLPAILKGWLERVMVPGVGFRFDERSGKVRPGLTNVDTIVGVSTYGSRRAYVRAINDNGRRMLTRALRMSCGLRTRTRWLGMYGLDTSTEVQRAEFAASVEQAMLALRRRGSSAR